MDPISAVVAFSIAAALLTITPGLDTALVLRTATVEGARSAMAAGAGVSAGVLAWGLLVSLGLGALLAVSEIGYRLLQIAGAAYLIWLGAQMIRAALRSHPGAHQALEAVGDDMPRTSRSGWFWRGMLTNLLNPKVGVFYVSFLPQFIPADVPVVAFSVGLAALHGTMGLLWFAALTAATQPFARLLRRPGFTRRIDGLTGAVLIGFGLRLAFERRG
ncbi:LysE family translocator [Rhodopseudomonas sp. HC1]|uniref:LysE family translocator n=1 Tax=Rhodopseudomonas infernalis TaxID=2897386 RepID=UPI001EE86013|nr:LysE family translocator [Rhodopseudomonas infernalis]MCG6203350.1 LysE family translocator [Rhodopseudomonas infernalis]